MHADDYKGFLKDHAICAHAASNDDGAIDAKYQHKMIHAVIVSHGAAIVSLMRIISNVLDRTGIAEHRLPCTIITIVVVMEWAFRRGLPRWNKL